MLHRVQAKRTANLAGAPKLFVADSCFPQTVDVLRGRAEPLGTQQAWRPLLPVTQFVATKPR